MPYSRNKLELLQDWLKANEELTHAKLVERSLRDEVVTAFSHRKFARDGENISGTESIEVFSDFFLKIQHRLSYELPPEKDKITKTMTSMQRYIPKPIVERVVTWKPTLVVGEYNRLPDNAKNVLRRIMTVKEIAKGVSVDNRTTGKDFLSILETRQ